MTNAVDKPQYAAFVRALQNNVYLKNTTPQPSPRGMIQELFDASKAGPKATEAAFGKFVSEQQGPDGSIPADTMMVDLDAPLTKADIFVEAIVEDSRGDKNLGTITRVDLATYCALHDNPYLAAVAVPIVHKLRDCGAITSKTLDAFCVAMVLRRYKCIMAIVANATSVDYSFRFFTRMTNVLDEATLVHTMVSMFRDTSTLPIYSSVALGSGVSVCIKENDPALFRDIIRRYKGEDSVDGRTVCKRTACVVEGTDYVINEPSALMMAVMSNCSSAELIGELIGRCPREQIDELFSGAVGLTFWQLLWQRDNVALWGVVVSYYYFMKANLHTSETTDEMRETYMDGLIVRGTPSGEPQLKYPAMEQVGLRSTRTRECGNASGSSSSASASTRTRRASDEERAMAQRMFGSSKRNRDTIGFQSASPPVPPPEPVQEPPPEPVREPMPPSASTRAGLASAEERAMHSIAPLYASRGLGDQILVVAGLDPLPTSRIVGDPKNLENCEMNYVLAVGNMGSRLGQNAWLILTRQIKLRRGTSYPSDWAQRVYKGGLFREAAKAYELWKTHNAVKSDLEGLCYTVDEKGDVAVRLLSEDENYSSGNAHAQTLCTFGHYLDDQPSADGALVSDMQTLGLSDPPVRFVVPPPPTVSMAYPTVPPLSSRSFPPANPPPATPPSPTYSDNSESEVTYPPYPPSPTYSDVSEPEVPVYVSQSNSLARFTFDTMTSIMAARNVKQMRAVWLLGCPEDIEEASRGMSSTMLFRVIGEFMRSNLISHLSHLVELFPHLLTRVSSDRKLRTELAKSGVEYAFEVSSGAVFRLASAMPNRDNALLRTVVEENVFLGHHGTLGSVHFEEPPNDWITAEVLSTMPTGRPRMDLGPRCTVLLNSNSFEELLQLYNLLQNEEDVADAEMRAMLRTIRKDRHAGDVILSEIRARTLKDLTNDDPAALSAFDAEWAGMMNRMIAIDNILLTKASSGIILNSSTLDDVLDTALLQSENKSVFALLMPHLDRLFHEQERIAVYDLCRYKPSRDDAPPDDAPPDDAPPDDAPPDDAPPDEDAPRDAPDASLDLDVLQMIFRSRTAEQLNQLCIEVCSQVATIIPNAPSGGAPMCTVLPKAAIGFLSGVMDIAGVTDEIRDDFARMKDRIQMDTELRMLLWKIKDINGDSVDDISSVSPEALVVYARSCAEELKEKTVPSRNSSTIARSVSTIFSHAERLEVHNSYFSATNGTRRRRANHRGGNKARAKRERAAASAAAAAAAASSSSAEGETAVEPPEPPSEPLPNLEDIVCPIFHTIFEDPVHLVGDGMVYDRDAITMWLRKNNTSPLTGKELDSQRELALVPLPALVEKIARYRAAYPDAD